MAIIYYPTSTTVNQRTVSGSAYTELDLQVVPNTVFFFNTSSQLDYATASIYPYTSSWAQSASYVQNAPVSDSSSFASTSSWAINAINGGTQLNTGSTYPITSSYSVTSSHAKNSDYAAIADTASWSTSGSAALIARTASYVGSIATASWSNSSSVSISSSWSNSSSVSISSSWALNTFSSSWANSSSWADNVISSSWANSSSWADNVISFSYVNSASYGVSSSWASASFTSSHALTASYFDSHQNFSGVMLSFADTASSEVNTSITNTAGVYTKATFRIDFKTAVQLISMSYLPAATGVYNYYFSSDTSSMENVSLIASSQSVNSLTASYSIPFPTTKVYFWGDIVYITVERVSGSMPFKRGTGAYTGVVWDGPYGSFFNAPSTWVAGAYAWPGGFYYKPYNGLDTYGNSLSTSSYAIKAESLSENAILTFTSPSASTWASVSVIGYTENGNGSDFTIDTNNIPRWRFDGGGEIFMNDTNGSNIWSGDSQRVDFYAASTIISASGAIVTSRVTASLLGTASWAEKATTASYVATGYTGNVYILDGNATTQHSMSFTNGILTSYTTV